jgi:hypothetical protein
LGVQVTGTWLKIESGENVSGSFALCTLAFEQLFLQYIQNTMYIVETFKAHRASFACIMTGSCSKFVDLIVDNVVDLRISTSGDTLLAGKLVDGFRTNKY